MDIATPMENQLLEHFIMREYLNTHSWLPMEPRKEAFAEYQGSPEIQARINGEVHAIIEIIERCDGSLHTKKS